MSEVLGLSMPLTENGCTVVAPRKIVRPKVTLITPNWCDKTTWYHGSIYVEDEVAQDSGDHQTYNLAHPYTIDTYHGKITFEDTLKDTESRSYRVSVKVNDVEKTEQDPHYAFGGDFTYDYVESNVIFNDPLQGTEVVNVTYHYADSSVFKVIPQSGKQLLIQKVEVQFSDNIEMKDSIVFQPYGYVQCFAPQMMEPPYNLPMDTQIPLGDPLLYKTIGDLLNDSNYAYPPYPAIGNGNWRSLKKPAYVFSWSYDVGATLLLNSCGMEIHIKLEHDEKCTGEFATAALYCTSEDET